MRNGYLDVLNPFRLNEFEHGSPPWPAPFQGLCRDLFKYIIHIRLNNIWHEKKKNKISIFLGNGFFLKGQLMSL